jgi:hypothetical protein
MTALDKKTGGMPNIHLSGWLIVRHIRSRLTPAAKLKGG